MSWTIDINNTNQNFKTGDIVRAISDPHKDRILIVFRVDYPTIYLEAASGTYILLFSRNCQDLRHAIQLVTPTEYLIYSAIELTSSSSTNNPSRCNTRSLPCICVACTAPIQNNVLEMKMCRAIETVGSFIFVSLWGGGACWQLV